MRLALQPLIAKALIVPALTLSLVVVAAPPSGVQRQYPQTPKQITVLNVEQSDAPPVSERQDGPLPPGIFR